MFEIFSDMTKGSKDFFTPERVIVIGIFIILSMFLMQYTYGKYSVMDSMDNGIANMGPNMGSNMGPNMGSNVGSNMGSNMGSNNTNNSAQMIPGYSAMPSANPSDLLPSDQNSQWAQLNPVNQDSPNMPDLLQAGYHIGLDTIGQTLKNPNLQLRSDPYISKSNVGPWNNSTYEPDLMRVPLEVGCAP